jgi:hypothetical protein
MASGHHRKLALHRATPGSPSITASTAGAAIGRSTGGLIAGSTLQLLIKQHRDSLLPSTASTSSARPGSDGRRGYTSAACKPTSSPPPAPGSTSRGNATPDEHGGPGSAAGDAPARASQSVFLTSTTTSSDRPVVVDLKQEVDAAGAAAGDRDRRLGPGGALGHPRGVLGSRGATGARPGQRLGCAPCRVSEDAWHRLHLIVDSCLD